MPAPGSAAFAWQGSVGGVNTGNGDKTTVLPLVAWTQRGGLPVSCALYHNSQGIAYANGGAYGYKWIPSYFTYLSPGPGGVTLHWDNGLAYPLTNNGDGTYMPPYGILDTLKAGGGGTFTLTTPGKVVYSFGFAPGGTGGYAYLSAITDLAGNTLTINHNPDTTLSSLVDATGRTLTYGYDGSGHLASVTDPLGRQWVLSYVGGGYLGSVQLPPVNGQTYSLYLGYGDGRQNLTSFQNARGNGSHFSYNGDNSLATAQDALGNTTTFTYYPDHTTITDPNGHTLTHTYAASRLASVTDALGKSESYVYDYNNILNSKTDKRGDVWGYSSQFATGNNNTSTSTDPLGNHSSVTYDPTKADKAISSVDALGNTTATTYSTDGHFDTLSAQVTGTGGSPFHATSSTGGYANGLPTTLTDALGYSSGVGYDGNAASATDANNNSSSAAYNALGWKLTGTDALSHTTTSTYDNWGRVVAVTAPDGTQAATTYDPDGNVLRVSDADASPLTLSSAVSWTTGLTGSALSFNGAGGAAAPTANLGNFGTGAFTVSCWVKTSGTAAQFIVGKRLVAAHSSFWDVYLQNGAACMELDGDANGTNYLNLVGTRIINDGAWHLITAVRSGASVTLFVDGTQDVTGSPAGPTSLVNTAPLTLGYTPAFSTYYYGGVMDEARVYSRALSGSEITSLAQQSPAVSTANGLQSYWNFNEGGGTVAYDACHSAVNTYDADDRLLTTTNGRGDVVTYTYDGPNGYGSTDGNGQPQFGLLSKKTDGNGHVTTYTYTARNEPYQTVYADGTSESVTYDAGGNVLTRTKPDGKVISYTYDADGRLTDITYPALHATHFGYDALGRRTLMTDATGTTTWTYGDGLHLTQTVTPQGTVNSAYDADSRRTQVSTPAAGAWTYSFDPGGRLTQIQNPYAEKTLLYYDAAGRLTQKTKGDGDYETYGYDVADQLTNIGYWWLGGAGRNFRAYTYDPAGSLIQDDQGYYALSYLYDGAGQLTGEVGSGSSPPPTLGYTYDHNGNRLTQTSGGSVVQQFTYDAHDKLTGGSGGETEGYDPNGNKTAMSVGGVSYAYTYDDEDRLTQISSSAGLLNTFAYNGLGLRVGKNDSTGSYSYLCDGTAPGSPVLSDISAVYTPGQSEHRGSTSSFYADDRLGNLWTLDMAGQSQAYYQDTSGFGALTAWGGGTASPFKFGGGNGCQSDADTGLVLMGHRYYDARIGRFLTQDPIRAGRNWYVYCGNDPVNGVDPSGLLPQMIDGVEIGLPRFVAAPGSPYDTSSGFRLIGVYGIHLDKNGNRMPGETPSFLYNIAVPLPINLIHNAEQAAGVGHNISNMISVGPTGLLKTGLGLRVQQDYYGNHVGHTTVGDLKAGIDQSKNPLLWQEADDAGNFNAGMIGAALGMHEWEVLLSGHVAHIKDTSLQGYMDGGFFDQPRGQQMLHDGYTFYQTTFGH